EASNAAIKASDAKLALSGVSELAKFFDVDEIALKADALSKIGATAATGSAHTTLVQNYLAIIDEAVASDSYEAAIRLVSAAEAAAKKAQDAQLTEQVKSRSKEVREAQTAFAAIKGARLTLATNAEQPEANLAVAKFLCVFKGDWDRGVPMMAKGSDFILKMLA